MDVERAIARRPFPPEAITHEALVDEVFAVMDKMSIEKCVLAGFSRGFMTVMRAVHRHPERFEGLVLMNGTGEIRLPDTTPRPLPSNFPGETHGDRLRWFIQRCMPEPNVEHVRRWGVNILSRAEPEAAEKIMAMQCDSEVDWATELAAAPHFAAPRRERLRLQHRDDALHRIAYTEQQARRF